MSKKEKLKIILYPVVNGFSKLWHDFTGLYFANCQAKGSKL